MRSTRVIGLVACAALTTAALAVPAEATPAPASAATLVPTVISPPKATLSAPSALASGVRSTIKATISNSKYGASRKVLLKGKLASSTTWTTLATVTWSGKSSATLPFVPPRSGAWQFRAELPASGTQPAGTGTVLSKSVATSKALALVTGTAQTPTSWGVANGLWDSGNTVTVRLATDPAKSGYSRSVRFEYCKVSSTCKAGGTANVWKLGLTKKTPTTSGVITFKLPTLGRGKYLGRLVAPKTTYLPAVTSGMGLFTITVGPIPPTTLAVAPITPQALGVVATEAGGQLYQWWNPSVSHTEMPAPNTFPAIRLWDSGVSWRDIERDAPVGGVPQYDWEGLKRVLDDADRKGQDVLYTFGGTPSFYAGGTASATTCPAPSPINACPPTRTADGGYDPTMASYRKFVREVIARFGNRIDSFQAANEINLPSQYGGSVAQATAMTIIVREELDRVSNKAGNVAASIAGRRPTAVDPVAPAYFAGLATYAKAHSNKWPVTAHAVHTYPLYTPTIDGGLPERDQIIGMFQRIGKEAGAPVDIPIWDTEANYRTNPTGFPAGHVIPDYSDSDVRTLVSQNYIRGLGYGVTRTYWYGWLPSPSDPTKKYLGIPMYHGTVATEAVKELKKWLVTGPSQARTIDRCVTVSDLTSCKVTFADNSVKWIVWSVKPDTSTTATPVDSLPVPVVIPGGKIISSLRTIAGTTQTVGPFTVTAEPALVSAS